MLRECFLVLKGVEIEEIVKKESKRGCFVNVKMLISTSNPESILTTHLSKT